MTRKDPKGVTRTLGCVFTLDLGVGSFGLHLLLQTRTLSLRLEASTGSGDSDPGLAQLPASQNTSNHAIELALSGAISGGTSSLELSAGGIISLANS